MPLLRINNFLEIMSEEGITKEMFLRFCRNKKYAQFVCNMMKKEFIDNPGAKTKIMVDYSISNTKLNKEMGEFGLREDIIEDIYISTTTNHILDEKYELEIFLVNLYKNVHLDEAIDLLDKMGLESVSLREGLTFATQCRFSEYPIIVLAACYKWQSMSEYFCINGKGLTLYDPGKSGFSSNVQFLVKRKNTA